MKYSSLIKIPLLASVAGLALSQATLSAAKIGYIYGDVSRNGYIPSSTDPNPDHRYPWEPMRLEDTSARGLSDFADMVAGEGHEIIEYYDAVTYLDAAFFAEENLDAIIFSLHQKQWSPEEISALNVFLNEGGGIFMYTDSQAAGRARGDGDPPRNNQVGQNILNSILEDHGMQVYTDQKGVQAFSVPQVAGHPILDVANGTEIADQITIHSEGHCVLAVDPTSDVEILIPYHKDYNVYFDSNLTAGPAEIQDDLGVDTQTYSELACLAMTTTENGLGRIVAMFDRQPMWNAASPADFNTYDNALILQRVVNHIATRPELSGFGVNSGGEAVAGDPYWDADSFFANGNTQTRERNVDLSLAGALAAPEEIYDTNRNRGNFYYTFDQLMPNEDYSVILHFSEYRNGAARRLFGVSLNGERVLDEFDIFVEANNQRNTAVVRKFDVTADGNGEIEVRFHKGSASKPIVNGIEIVQIQPQE